MRFVLKNQEMVAKAFFMNVTKNNKTFCQKKVVGCSKVLFLAFLTPSNFFWQNVLLLTLSHKRLYYVLETGALDTRVTIHEKTIN